MNWSWSWLFPWLRPAPAPLPLPPPPVTVPNVAADLLEFHNAARRTAGRPPLGFSAALQRAAESHAQRMAALGILAHEGIGDGDPELRAGAAGYRLADLAENIAAGSPTAADVMALWLHSPPHRANILGPYTDFGGAVAARLGGGLYWCAVFGEAV